MKRKLLLTAALAITTVIGGAHAATQRAFDSYSTSTGQYFDWDYAMYIDDDKDAPVGFHTEYNYLYEPAESQGEHHPVNECCSTKDFTGSTTSHTFPYPAPADYGDGELSHFCIRIKTAYSARDVSDWSVLVCPGVNVPE